jgi:hypothetical protein
MAAHHEGEVMQLQITIIQPVSADEIDADLMISGLPEAEEIERSSGLLVLEFEAQPTDEALCEVEALEWVGEIGGSACDATAVAWEPPESIELELEYKESTYHVEIEHPHHTDPEIEIMMDGVWAGVGRLRRYGIEDCAAILPEGAYEAIDEALRAAGLCS